MPHDQAPASHVTLLHDARIDASDFLDDVRELDVIAELLLLGDQPLDGFIRQDAFRIAQSAHHETCVEL